MSVAPEERFEDMSTGSQAATELDFFAARAESPYDLRQGFNAIAPPGSLTGSRAHYLSALGHTLLRKFKSFGLVTDSDDERLAGFQHSLAEVKTLFPPDEAVSEGTTDAVWNSYYRILSAMEMNLRPDILRLLPPQRLVHIDLSRNLLATTAYTAHKSCTQHVYPRLSGRRVTNPRSAYWGFYVEHDSAFSWGDSQIGPSAILRIPTGRIALESLASLHQVSSQHFGLWTLLSRPHQAPAEIPVQSVAKGNANQLVDAVDTSSNFVAFFLRQAALDAVPGDEL